MGNEVMVRRLDVDGDVAWLKRYGSARRAVRMRAMDWTALRLGVIPLRAPPRHVGPDGRRVEQRRLSELALLDANVPRVLASGDDCLLLSDMGQTLSECLRRSSPDEARMLVARAVEAIAAVHARGGYVGAPVARNLTVDEQGRIGFIDFEEDPGEVMSLPEAQARDWLVFSAGVSRHVSFDERELATLLAPGLRRAPQQSRSALAVAVDRLAFLRRPTAWLGGRAAGIGKALGSLGRAIRQSGGGVFALMAILAADLLHDGDIELLALLAGMLD